MKRYIKHQINRHIDKIFFQPWKLSYSQTGEDRIIHLITKIIKLEEIFYLDIGASDPTSLNNTYYFYLLGHNGLCVDANPEIVKLFKKVRPKDRCITYGVCGNEEECGTKREFYVLSSKALSSFSKKIHKEMAGEVREKIDVEMISINRLISDFCKKTPNIISIDAEGMDNEIVRSIDFEKYKPEILCIETLSFVGEQVKDYDLISFLIDHNYIVIADTYINTIFVRHDVFKKFRNGNQISILPKI